MSWSRAWLAPCQYMRGGKCRLEFGHQVAGSVSARTSFLLLENKIKNVEQDGQNLTWELHPSKYADRDIWSLVLVSVLKGQILSLPL